MRFAGNAAAEKGLAVFSMIYFARMFIPHRKDFRAGKAASGFIQRGVINLFTRHRLRMKCWKKLIQILIRSFPFQKIGHRKAEKLRSGTGAAKPSKWRFLKT